jgi:hypothetical protein
MSKRTSILKALAVKLNEALDGSQYTSNIYGNAFPKLKFWDEVSNFSSIYMSPGSEQREYLPSAFTWAYLGISLKLYCKGEDAQEQLEQLLEDVESVIDANRVLVYDTVNNYETTEILISSITTDEGLLAPYAVGEINLQVRYALP